MRITLFLSPNPLVSHVTVVDLSPRVIIQLFDGLELGLEYVATLWCNMCFLSLCLSLSLSLSVGRVRVSPSSFQLLVVSFIVWSAGVSVTQSWLWSIRGVLSF